jgi:hypothetical protein
MALSCTAFLLPKKKRETDGQTERERERERERVYIHLFQKRITPCQV